VARTVLTGGRGPSRERPPSPWTTGFTTQHNRLISGIIRKQQHCRTGLRRSARAGSFDRETTLSRAEFATCPISRSLRDPATRPAGVAPVSTHPARVSISHYKVYYLSGGRHSGSDPLLAPAEQPFAGISVETEGIVGKGRRSLGLWLPQPTGDPHPRLHPLWTSRRSRFAGESATRAAR
jgi:hypothetical protein